VRRPIAAMNLVFTSGPADDWPYGIPEDLFDEQGFPRPLYVARREIEARGGRIEGEGYKWTVVAPEPEVPGMRLWFVTEDPDAGDAGVKVDGAKYTILIDVAMVCQTYEYRPPFDPDMTWTDGVLVGVLNGGYREFVGYNECGEPVTEGWQLKGPLGGDGNERFNMRIPLERRVPVRREWRTFPAWPEPEPEPAAAGGDAVPST